MTAYAMKAFLLFKRPLRISKQPEFGLSRGQQIVVERHGRLLGLMAISD